MKRVRTTAYHLLMRYLMTDPMKRLPAMLRVAEKLDQEKLHASQIQALKQVLLDKNSIWHDFAEKMIQEVDRKVLARMVESFIINANLKNAAHTQKLEKQYGCNIPWAILLDPTSACNLSCTGCWAAQYGGKNNLSNEMLESIVSQGKELGVFFYIFSGGEPLVRKQDILRLCGMHKDCYFFAFTNGTLVDDAFCDDLLKVRNFALAFSIEGDEAATDMRRGAGTYRKVIKAMERMRAHKLLFGYSTCYHRYNTESVGSDAFIDDMIARGCRFSWNFTYMPVGKDAVPDLLATPEQRAYMYRRIREVRSSKPIFAMDFWNDGEYTCGCIAGGRRYLHINAAGDVEPCAFIHYSNVNIHDVSLLHALRSPLFMAYRKRQPFNSNHLRPCPLLDNPQELNAMVKESGARSTDMASPEDIDTLCQKTAKAADSWAEVAGGLWDKRNLQAEATNKAVSQ